MYHLFLLLDFFLLIFQTNIINPCNILFIVALHNSIILIHESNFTSKIESCLASFKYQYLAQKDFFSKILSKYEYFKSETWPETRRDEIFKFIEIKYKRKNLFVLEFIDSIFLDPTLHEYKLKQVIK